MKRKVALILLVTIYLLPAAGQSNWQEALHSWLTAEDVEESYGEETMELLEERAAHKINLNQATREELEELPFLSAQQIEGIIAYRDHYHPIRTMNELMMVSQLDYQTRQLLPHFVEVGEEKPKRIWPTWDELKQYGQHSLTATAKVPFYERKGDQSGYLGYKYRHDVRYQFRYGNRLKAGLTAAQDAGEPFFAHQNSMGYDQYSFYLQLRDMGRLEELNLGMYRVQMGMGLLMNTGLLLGKAAILQNLGRSTHTLTAHSSRSSSNYLQGAAATLRLSKAWRMTLFASLRDIDATLNDDGTMRTRITDGYHRTPTEMDKKHNTRETDLGGSIGWRQGTLYVKANAVYTHFNRDLLPLSASLYQRYAARGNDFLNISLDYGFTHSRWAFSGETAMNRQGALAALHTISVKASDKLSMMLLHRYYDKRYTALHARSFSEGGHVQNEHGIYLGSSWRPSRPWLIEGYVDYAHFAWPRYLVTASSDAFDAMVTASHVGKRWTLKGRYRLHIRQQDNPSKTMIVNKTEHRMRLSADWEATSALTLRSQVDAIAARTRDGREKGIMVGSHGCWKQKGWKIDGHMAWFRTDGYDSRLYQYESSVAYDFSFPMYYGHGIRYALMVQGGIGQHLKMTAKMGVTNYFDRSSVGTGLQQVDRSSLADLLIQIHYLL